VIGKWVNGNFMENDLPITNYTSTANDLILRDNQVVGVNMDGEVKAGFDTPSRKLEFFSDTLASWGWHEKENVIPWSLKSHVHQDFIDRKNGEMILLPNFRLPTLIHTRSANAKWLYEILLMPSG
jgi:hypothetical protein